MRSELELCRFLRWKTWYGNEAFTPEDLQQHFARNEVPYSCNRTCLAWGPDDAPALPESCGSHRRCFEPSSRLIRALT